MIQTNLGDILVYLAIKGLILDYQNGSLIYFKNENEWKHDILEGND